MARTGEVHEIGTCQASQRTRRLVTCKRCNAVNLVWHSCERTGGTDKGWAMYGRAQHIRGRVVADTSAPHVCPGRPQATSPEPVGDEPLSDLRARVAMLEAEIGVAARELMTKVDERIDALAIPARALTVEIRSGETIRTIDGAHSQVPELLYWCGARDVNGFRYPVMLFGKPGVSKSYSARQVADAMKLSFGLISLNPQTPESRLFGFYHANGGYIRTQFREAFENGGMFLIDEIDNASDSLLTSLNSCLANGHGAFPDGLVARHDDFVCVATANTPGRGGDINHSGRRPLDAATINRFVCIEWRNDDDLELRLAETVNPRSGRAWLDWIRRVREYCAQHHPRVIVSPRSTMTGAKALLDSPFSVEQIADMTLFKGLDRDTRAKILSACPLPEVIRG